MKISDPDFPSIRKINEFLAFIKMCKDKKCSFPKNKENTRNNPRLIAIGNVIVSKQIIVAIRNLNKRSILIPKKLYIAEL